MKRKLCVAAGLLTTIALAAMVLADDQIICRRVSDFNTIIVTEDDEGLLTLYFELYGARQSVVKPGDPDHLELPYAKAMFSALAVVEDPKTILVVGLGGGTIPCFLRHHYPQAHIDTVDIDPEVVNVAKEFFGFKEDKAMRAYVEDGRSFIEARPNRYDVIFLDAFSSDSIPYHLTTIEFLKAVRTSLTEEGAVFSNVWSRGSNRMYDSMVRTYQAVFGDMYINSVVGSGNRVLIGLNKQRTLDAEKLAARAGKISTAKGFKFDLSEVVKNGFHPASEEELNGKILRDVDEPEE